MSTVFDAGRRYIKKSTQKPYIIVDVDRTGSGQLHSMDLDKPAIAYKRDGWGEQDVLVRTVESFSQDFVLVPEPNEAPHENIDANIPLNWFRQRVGWEEETGKNDGEKILSITGGRPESYCAHAVASSFADTVGALPEHVTPTPKKLNPLAWCPTLMSVCRRAGWIKLVGEYGPNNLPPKSDDKQTVVVFMGSRLDSDKLDDVSRKSDVKHVGILESSEVVGGKVFLKTIEANTTSDETGKQGIWRKRRNMQSDWVVAFAIVPHAAVAKPKSKKLTAVKNTPTPAAASTTNPPNAA